MKNKKGNVAVIAIIIVIVAITTGVITWLVATNSQAPVQQAVVTQPAPVAKTQPTTQPITQPTQDPTSLSKNGQVKADNAVCQSYSNVLSKYGDIKYDTLSSEGIILDSRGAVCSIAVKKDTSSPNKENEIDTIISALSKDGWQEDSSMKRDTGAVGNYNSIYGYKKGDSILVLEFNVSSPQAQVSKCMEITDSNLSGACFNEILKTETITIMAGSQQ